MQALIEQWLTPIGPGNPLANLAGPSRKIGLFSRDRGRANNEAIQADIHDHSVALIHEFGLHAFQQPSGTDCRLLAGQPTGWL